MKSKAAETHFIIDSKEKSICSYILEGAISIKKQRTRQQRSSYFLGSHGFLTWFSLCLKPLCQKLMGSYKRSASSTCLYWLLETHSQLPGPAGKALSPELWRSAKTRKVFACEWFRISRRCSEVPFAHTEHFAFAHLRKQNCIEGGCVSSDCQEIEWGLFGSNEQF